MSKHFFIMFLQTDEYSLVYSTTAFTKKEADKKGRRDSESEEEESIYSDIMARPLN